MAGKIIEAENGGGNTDDLDRSDIVTIDENVLLPEAEPADEDYGAEPEDVEIDAEEIEGDLDDLDNLEVSYEAADASRVTDARSINVSDAALSHRRAAAEAVGGLQGDPQQMIAALLEFKEEAESSKSMLRAAALVQEAIEEGATERLTGPEAKQ